MKFKFPLIISLTLFAGYILSCLSLITKFSFVQTGDNIHVYINNQLNNILPGDITHISTLAISFDNDIPEPNPFHPQLVGVVAGTKILCQKSNCSRNFVFPSGIRTFEITTSNALFLNLVFGDDNHFFQYQYQPFRERQVVLTGAENNQAITSDSRWRLFDFSFSEILLLSSRIIFLSTPFVLILLLLNIVWPNFKIKVLKIKSRLLYLIFSAIPYFLILISLVYLLWVNTVFVERIPHSPDSVAYVWAAKYLANFKLWLPLPPANFFDIDWLWNSNFCSVIIWPLGHPLLLAFGSLFNATWVIPPLVGSLTLLLLFLIIKNLFSHKVALITIVLVAFSPFFQMHAATFMSHNSAAFYLCLGLFALIKLSDNSFKSNPVYSVILGLSLILLSQTRIIIGVISITSVCCYLGYLKLKSRVPMRYFYSFLISLFVGICSVLVFNYFVYGSFLNTPYVVTNASKTILSSDSKLNFLPGLTDAVSYLIVLSQITFPGLPLLFSFLFLFSFFNSKHKTFHLFVLGNILAVIIAQSSFEDVWGIFYGPRFWYDFFPLLIIIFAFAIDYLSVSLKPTLKYPFFIALIFFVIYRSIFGWVLTQAPLWSSIPFTPSSIEELKGFNFTDARLIQNAAHQNIHHAIIFVNDCSGSWWCYGSVHDQNSADLNGDIIWARNLGINNFGLVTSHSNRKLYSADYDTNTILPYSLPPSF